MDECEEEYDIEENTLSIEEVETIALESDNLENVQHEVFELPKEYSSREELLDYVRITSIKQGFAVSIKKSKRDRFVLIGCDRGGEYRNRLNIATNDRKRKTSSRLINCPFEVQGKRKNDGSWLLTVVNASHNHDPSMDMSEDEIASLKSMVNAGIPPRQILSSLRQNNPNLQVISKTVYNMKAKIRKDYLCGRTMIQALFEEFGTNAFQYNVKYDSEGHLTHLFFAHPVSIALTKSYFNVFVMDCTYKTNKYKMPLLDIIGVSSFNSSFYSCFAFMQKEEEADYVWVLSMFSNILGADCQPSVIVSDRELALMNAIQVVFPRTANLICVWHIEKNILAKCKPHFEDGNNWSEFLCAWTAVVYSANELEYNQTWEHLESQYKEKSLVLNYIKSTWLPFKEKFVSAWTEMHSHFGNRATSRAEGAHATLKKYLQVSSGDLCDVKNKICLAIENQFQEIKTKLSSEKIRIPHRFHISLLKELITHVSVFALDEILNQYKISKSETELFACKNHFTKTMGLPCAHRIQNSINGVLHLSDINPQWRLDIRSFMENDVVNSGKDDKMKGLLDELQHKYHEWHLSRKDVVVEQVSQLVNTPVPFILEPNIEPHKGRPSGSKSKKTTNSTRRDPSGFEIVEKSRPKCSICKGVGHNSRTCQQKANDLESFHPMRSNVQSDNLIDLNAPAISDYDLQWN